jgi:hypothetical protein
LQSKGVAKDVRIEGVFVRVSAALRLRSPPAQNKRRLKPHVLRLLCGCFFGAPLEHPKSVQTRRVYSALCLLRDSWVLNSTPDPFRDLFLFAPKFPPPGVHPRGLHGAPRGKVY